jgi:tRNA G18 (ribose-2'-O)-methylase SpoU
MIESEPEDFLLLEGALLVERGIEAGLEIMELACVPARESWIRGLLGPDGPISVLPEEELASMAGYPFHRGVLARARRPPERDPRELASALGARSQGAAPRTILLLPELSDPENLGSTFRSAAAFGAEALLIGPRCPDPYSRRCLRVSMAASLSLPWARLSGPGELEPFAEAGFDAAACVLDPDAIRLESYRRPLRLLLALGNEAFGLSPPWLEACGTRITLPMLGGADSLNVAVAAAIFLYSLSNNESPKNDSAS